jgi:hypothetical protein
MDARRRLSFTKRWLLNPHEGKLAADNVYPRELRKATVGRL